MYRGTQIGKTQGLRRGTNSGLMVGTAKGAVKDRNPRFKTVLAMDTIVGIRVPVGTAFGDINFADYYRDQVAVLCSDLSIKNVKIIWNSGNYSGGSAASFTLKGALVLPSGLKAVGFTPTLAIDVVTLESEVQAVITAATTAVETIPTPICIGEINAWIAGLKADSAFATKDVCYCFMNDGSKEFSTYNYKNPATNRVTINGTVTWTSRKGFTGDGVTGYLSTNFNTSTATNFTQNASGFGAYIYNEGTVGHFLGSVATGARVALFSSSRLTVSELNGNTSPSYTDPFSIGYHHIYRTGSTTIFAIKNSITYVNPSDTSVARPNANIYLLARDNAGSADLFSDCTISHFWAGASLSTKTLELSTRWATYLQSVRVKNTYTPQSTVGIKENDTFARAALGGNYVVNAGTFACDGTKLNISGGASDFLKTMVFKNYASSTEQCLVESVMTNTITPGAATNGSGPIFKDFAGTNGERSIYSQLNMSTGASAGKCILWTWDGTTSVQVAISSTAIPTLANGDVFNFSVQKTISGGLVTYNLTVVRVSDSATVTCSYSNILGDSTGDIGIATYGGTQSCSLLKITYGDSTNAPATIIGDSLSHGAFVSNLALRLSSNIVAGAQVSAGSGDTTGDVVGSGTTIIGKLRSIVDLHSAYYFLIIGGNDVAAGISSSIWQNNIRKMVFALMNEGHQVILVVPPARNDADMTTIRTFYTSTFPTLTMIDGGYLAVVGTGTNLKAAFNFGDNVHMPNDGHIAYAKGARLQLPVLYKLAV